MLRVETLDEAEAAEAAGVDLVSVPPALLGPAFREAAPSVCLSRSRIWRSASRPTNISAPPSRRSRPEATRSIARQACRPCGACATRAFRSAAIVGLIPSKATWTGGFRAVGKTAVSALEIWRQIKALEEAGAFAAEIEVVPGEVAERDQRAHLDAHALDGRRHWLRRAISFRR